MTNLIKGQRKFYTVYIGIGIPSHLKERVFFFFYVLLVVLL